MLDKRQNVILYIVVICTLLLVILITSLFLISSDEKDSLSSDNSPNILPPVSDYDFYGDNDVSNYKIEDTEVNRF